MLVSKGSAKIWKWPQSFGFDRKEPGRHRRCRRIFITTNTQRAQRSAEAANVTQGRVVERNDVEGLKGVRWRVLIVVAVVCFSVDHGSIARTPLKRTTAGRNWAKETLKHLTLEEKVGQMLQLRYFADYKNFDDSSYLQLREQLQKYHIGSLTLMLHYDRTGMLRCSALQAAGVANQLQRDSKLPLLLAADFERAAASRLKDVPDFPWPMALGASSDVSSAEQFGKITAQEARAIGIQWVLAPVADVNSNPVNPIINVRSYGEDPEQVGNFVAAFIRGAHENYVLVTAKHFPGHGDSSIDSHREVPILGGDLDHLENNELPPFKKAIEAGVDAILLAHARVPALEPDPEKIATTSSLVVSGFLKNRLGFKGVVVTDATNMSGLTKLYNSNNGSTTARAAVDAVKAGSDVIMWPSDLDGAFHAIVNAVRSGEIPESQIDESVRKILEMKALVGLDKSRFVDVERASALTGRPEDMDFAQHIADEAVTLVRNNSQVLPLWKSASLFNNDGPFVGSLPKHRVVAILLAQTMEGSSGRKFEQALKMRRPDASVFYVDRHTAAAMAPEVLKALKDAEAVVVVAYVVPREAMQVVVGDKLVNSFGLLGPTGHILQQILTAANNKTVVIAMGSPYLIRNFPQIQTYICTFAITSTSENSAAKALFGEIQNHSKLPVTLSGIAPRGFSLPWPTQKFRQHIEHDPGAN
jgi:beta-N-acetylhexosaminidase